MHRVVRAATVALRERFAVQLEDQLQPFAGGEFGGGRAQVVADGTDQGAFRVERVLTNDPGTGVMRHADAGYDIARRVARERGVDIPML